MLGNPELERALLEQTYDSVMTVTGTSKQEVGGETVVTPDAVLHENIPCALSFSGTPDSRCREILAQRERIASRVACLGQRVPLFMQFPLENPSNNAIL